MMHLALEKTTPRGSSSNIRPRIAGRKKKNPLMNQRVFAFLVVMGRIELPTYGL
ncbi:MAG: hypothetical protein KKE51_09515 [Gammaproteobacteria bacterium]|nr:hypothetical protein [Gammaproteobacteria bacterium]MBU1602629.1 hypothetical protein [Gammaproteobacteria bacterium]MBU2433434.1 hypothetical protein [Gammaproteobacteria bacterium]MBU2451350.1 hypothetical protein [Gammaproteobacteria bacterium]